MKKKKDLWVKRFEDEVLPVLKKEYSPIKMILFGSRIRGKPKRYSDITPLSIDHATRSTFVLIAAVVLLIAMGIQTFRIPSSTPLLINWETWSRQLLLGGASGVASIHSKRLKES